MRVRRPGGCDLAARRRPNPADRPDDGVGQGCPAARGARVFERVRVIDVLTDGRAVTGVRTDAGDIEPRSWSAAPGSGPRRSARWPVNDAAVLGRSTSTSSPKPSPGAPGPADPARPRRLHLLKEVGGLVIGGFEPEPNRGWPGQIPCPSSSSCSTGTGGTSRSYAQCAAGFRPGAHRFAKSSTTAEASPRTTSSSSAGPRSARTSSSVRDSLGRHRLGQRGRARALASGSSTVSPPPISRASTSAASPLQRQRGLAARPGGRVLGVHYEIPGPTANSPPPAVPPLPVHHLLVAANANFGSRMGWETNWFAPPGTER